MLLAGQRRCVRTATGHAGLVLLLLGTGLVACTSTRSAEDGPAPPPGTPPGATPPDSIAPTRTATPAPPTDPGGTHGHHDPVLVGAGDIASCSSPGDEATAALLDDIAGTVFTTGDNVYERGSAAEFASCYQHSWGRHVDRTRPAAGNHDYSTPTAVGYFDYFGAAAGERGEGYYSYDLGAWHIVVVNSNCWAVGGCDSGSAQLEWLRADLAASTKRCTLAYWHHPLFTSGAVHDGEPRLRPVFQELYRAGAEVVLTGHNHQYERFAPQDPEGAPDTARGIRQFVVGTGGGGLYDFGTVQPNSQVRNADTYGVLKLTLHPGSYDWRFVPQAGESFTDSGTGECH